MDPILVVVAAALAVLLAIALATFATRALRNSRLHDKQATEQHMAELARLQAETGARIDVMRDMLAGRQAELTRAVNERLDSVSHHLGQSMTSAREQTVESLQKLN